MICERCGTVFCWDEADEYAVHGRKLYCSTTCKTKASAARTARARMRLQACIDRENRKRRYATEREALLAAAAFRSAKRRWLFAYKCPCGWWHLTSDAAQEPVTA
jgi:formylmethanofuran dehydrogenase subunit B